MSDEQNIPEKIIPESPNFQTELAAQIAEIAPQIVSDGKLDVNKLRELVNGDAETTPEKFGLFWPGKQRAQAVAQLPTTATLKPAPEESVDWDTTKNIFIEGDNLEVLKTLQDSYRRKIKMIYIDPPYNTGKEFIYPDNFQEGLQTYLEYTGQKNEAGENTESKKETGGRKHSSWLSMMYPRLQLAKSLLTDDGVIFISIDDNESSNLRRLADEVFGEENFLGQIIWNHSKQTKNDEPFLASNHNYILLYRKSVKREILRTPRTEAHNINYSNPDNDPKGDWRSGDVRSPSLRTTLKYIVTTPKGNVIQPPENGWRWSEKEINEKIRTGEIVFNADESRIIRKIYLKDQIGRIAESIWDGEQVGTTRSANAHLKELFDNKVVFDTPKPVDLIIELIKMLSLDVNYKDFLALDFFAGSGTLAESILKLNILDGGTRSSIQIQLPEHTYDIDVNGEKIAKKANKEAYEAGYEKISQIAIDRIKKSTDYLKSTYSTELQKRTNMLDTGFRVYKLATSNFAEWDEIEAAKDPTQAVLNFASNINIKATSEELLSEIMLRSRITLDAKVEKKNLNSGGWIYIINGGQLITYVDDAQLTVEQATEIADMQPAKFVALDSAFNNNDALKINISNICRDKHVGEFKTI